MRRDRLRRPPSLARGSALLEVLISVGLLAVGAMAVLLVNSTLIASSTVGYQRAEAALLAQELVVMASTDPGNAGCYATSGSTACSSEVASQRREEWQARVANRLPGLLSDGVVAQYDSDQTFMVTLQWRSARASEIRNLRLATHLGT